MARKARIPEKQSKPEPYGVSAHAYLARAEKRLASGRRFGTRAYAAEELVAELTSAFVCASLGITGALRHAEYIGHWVELLKEDNRAIFTAASKASAATEFLRQSPNLSEAESEAAA